MELNLEIEKAVEAIKEEKAKKVLIQLPDGLKPKAEEIERILKKETKAEIYFWASSCYGSCDLPQIEGFDLLIHFGHSKWS